MRRGTFNFVSRRVPKRWIVLAGLLVSVYIVHTFFDPLDIRGGTNEFRKNFPTLIIPDEPPGNEVAQKSSNNQIKEESGEDVDLKQAPAPGDGEVEADLQDNPDEGAVKKDDVEEVVPLPPPDNEEVKMVPDVGEGEGGGEREGGEGEGEGNNDQDDVVPLPPAGVEIEEMEPEAVENEESKEEDVGEEQEIEINNEEEERVDLQDNAGEENMGENNAEDHMGDSDAEEDHMGEHNGEVENDNLVADAGEGNEEAREQEVIRDDNQEAVGEVIKDGVPIQVLPGAGPAAGEVEGVNQVIAPAPADNVEIPRLYYGNEGLDPHAKGYTMDREKLSDEEKQLYDKGYELNGFNGYLSDLVSVDRDVPDARDPLCKNKEYPSELPDTSVVICFLNEAFSILVRCVHSITRTAPEHLLKEIILVDDFSDYDNLKAPLDVYMRRFPKVRIVRNTEREGLIRSRLNGAAAATGQVVTFLDSHIECVEGWLPPLLTRIKEDRTVAVWPAIPTIDRHTLKLQANTDAKQMQMGVFNWQMTFMWEIPNVAERESPVSPIRTPTMAGGLFAIDRDYFYHVGSYDEQMTFWGAENLEISFRIWMCGGRVEMIPCSVIGHIYRETNVNAKHAKPDSVRINTERAVMVWLDEYKELYEHSISHKMTDYGNISSRLAVRERLQCHSFDWYLNNVYPAFFVPRKALSSGKIHSMMNSSMCVQAGDSMNIKLTMTLCSKDYNRNQMFYLTEHEEIRHLANCVDAGQTNPVMYPCHRMKSNQHYSLTEEHTIYQVVKNQCLHWKEGGNELEMVTCDGGLRQKWILEPQPTDSLPEDIRKFS